MKRFVQASTKSSRCKSPTAGSDTGRADTAQQRSSLVPAQVQVAPVGAENRVMLCDLHVLVEEAAEPVSSEYADGRPGGSSGVAHRRVLVQ